MDRAATVSRRTTRLAWAALAGTAAGVLVVARRLTPDPSGVGTHVQLGLPPCGFLRLTSLPCPTCGLTTSFAHMARLQFTPAFDAHWLGPPLFALTVVTIAICAWSCVRATPLSDAAKRLRVARAVAIIVGGAMIVWLLRLLAIFLG
jgi:hypothetical protein